MGDYNNWRRLIAEERETQKDTTPVVACTLSEQELDVIFYDGFGGADGAPFTLWTEARVYFPVVYDGAEWCGSVPRNPCEEKTPHQGGG